MYTLIVEETLGQSQKKYCPGRKYQKISGIPIIIDLFNLVKIDVLVE